MALQRIMPGWVPDMSACDSLENGVILPYNRVRAKADELDALSLLYSAPPNARLRVCECCLRHLHVFSPFSPPVPLDNRCVLLPPARRSRARLPPTLLPCPTPV